MQDETSLPKAMPPPEAESRANGDSPPVRKGRGGSKPGERRGGNRRGTKHKKTLEREAKKRLEAEYADTLRTAAAVKSSAIASTAAGKELAKDILRKLMEMAAGLCAMSQPWPASRGKNPNENLAEFKEWFDRAGELATRLAPFESPRFSAVMIGATTVTKIEVTGGMPDDFAAAPTGVLVPGTIITADYAVVPETSVPPAKDAA